MSVGYCDLCADGTQVIGDFIDTGTSIHFGATTIDLTQASLFTRSVSGLSTQFAVVKGQTDGHGLVVNQAGTIVDVGGTYGDFCVALQIVGGLTLRVVWIANQGQYMTQTFDAALTTLTGPTATAIPQVYTGTSQGILDLNTDGTPIFTDAMSPGTFRGVTMDFPVVRNGIYAGQADTSTGLPPQIITVNPAGATGTVYLGNAFPPHLTLMADGTVGWALFTLAGTSKFGSLTPFPALVGSLAGHVANVNPSIYQPIKAPMFDPTTGLVTQPWALYFQQVASAASGSGPQNSGSS